MAIVRAQDCVVEARADGKIALQVPAGGRDRLVVMEPADAVQIGMQLFSAMTELPAEPAGIPVVQDVLMSPYGTDGSALLRFDLGEILGEIILKIDAKRVLALSHAANGALEHIQGAGNA